MARVAVLSDTAILDTSWLLELYRVPRYFNRSRTSTVVADTRRVHRRRLRTVRHRTCAVRGRKPYHPCARWRQSSRPQPEAARRHRKIPRSRQSVDDHDRRIGHRAPLDGHHATGRALLGIVGSQLLLRGHFDHRPCRGASTVRKNGQDNGVRSATRVVFRLTVPSGMWTGKGVVAAKPDNWGARLTTVEEQSEGSPSGTRMAATRGLQLTLVNDCLNSSTCCLLG